MPFWCAIDNCGKGPFEGVGYALDHAIEEHKDQWYEALNDLEFDFVYSNFTENPPRK